MASAPPQQQPVGRKPQSAPAKLHQKASTLRRKLQGAPEEQRQVQPPDTAQPAAAAASASGSSSQPTSVPDRARPEKLRHREPEPETGDNKSLPEDQEQKLPNAEEAVRPPDTSKPTDVPVDAPDTTPGDLSILDGLEVQDGGKVYDREGNLIGEVAEGDPEDLVGQTVNAEGEIVDDEGDPIGIIKLVAPQLEDQDSGDMETPGEGVPLNDENVAPEKPDATEKADEAGGAADNLVGGDKGKDDIGNEEERGDQQEDIIPSEKPDVPEPEADTEALKEQELPDIEANLPDISTLEGLKCNKLGHIVREDGTPVGELTEGDARKLARGGSQLDSQGQFWDGQGHVVGKAKPIQIEEEEPGPFADAGDLFVVDDGMVQDEHGRTVGRVVEGDAKKLLGRAVDDDGDILDKRGNAIGRAEPYEPPEEEEKEEEEEESQDLSALAGLVVNKLGNIVDNNGTVIGRITEGNPKKMAGKKVDGQGQIWSDAGKVIGQAELIPDEEREKPEGEFSGLEGLTVGKEGMIMDSSGEVVGRLVEGDQQRLKGRAVDEDGEVIDKLGNVIGRAERWSQPEEPEPELSPEEAEKQRQEKEDEDLAKKMSGIVQQTLDSVGPLCRQISQHIEKANQTPKDELDEEQLVKDVKPLIEEAGNALQECKATLRALDPDGHIAEMAKARSATHDATPAEQHLADLLKELTQTVAETIDNGRRLIADMPHAKKEINPMWALLSEPLVQIIAAVGLLLSGVLGLVSNLLNGLGLGGLLGGLLGNLGLDKVLEGFGLGSVTEALGIEGKK
ncbi:hypothetical protein BJY01DRAFT_246441 [Aspergillus pseudoustus]|uniref:DUF6987 domain-containing protein n=1 Tax=Aspergillus pseudoustus TaxID=1810923 RepID=A0ABR4K9G2_9EURO